MKLPYEMASLKRRLYLCVFPDMNHISKVLIVSVLICCSLSSQAGRKLRVLFIGNSYTYVNDLPSLVSSFATSMGDTLIYDSYTVGAYRFADHASDPLCIQKIQSAKWDLIVMQEQSQTPAMPTGYFFTNSYHYAHTLDTIIEHSDPCTQKMYYMTWGRKNGDTGLCNSLTNWPAVCTYNGMDSLLKLRYRSYADTSLPPAMGYPLVPGSWFSPIRLSQLSPVGAVWHYIRDHYPNLDLYWADESHPTETGSYIAASTFYAALFRRDPSLSTFNYTLPAADAANIRAAAKLLVFDSLHIWSIGVHDLRSQFRYQVVGGNQVIMINISSGTLDFQWDLGDGTTSTSGTFFHTFPAAAKYTVRLIATNGTCSDTSYGVVDLTTTGVSGLSSEGEPFTMSPNPARNTVTVKPAMVNAAYSLSVTDAVGRLVKHQPSLKGLETIDISAWSPGTYLFRFEEGENRVFYQKIVKQ